MADLNQIIIHSNLSTMHHGHLGDRRKSLLWRGGHYREVGVSYDNSFYRVQHIYCASFLLTVSHNVNPIINKKSKEIKI